jgi:hypothetical protein
MIASKVTRETLESAAAEIGVTLDVTTLNAKGTRHRVKVNPGSLPPEAYYRCGSCKGTGKDVYTSACAQCRGTGRSWRKRKGEAGDNRYQRTSASYMRDDRRVFAVCWHGFRDFFRAVYRVTPDAIFRTAMDTWRGSADFEARFPESGHKNIGAPIAPIAAAEACRCPSSGYAG